MITLHRAPWVLPISSPAIADGAVLVNDEQIVAVGRYADLCNESYDRFSDHEAQLLMPALVNAHCHLELSSCAVLGQQEVEPGNMPAWIAGLLALREKQGAAEVDVSSSQAALKEQYIDGVGLVIDVGNGQAVSVQPFEGITVDYFMEILGLSEQATTNGLKIIEEQSADHCITGHAPYSTSRVLLQALKKRAQQSGQLFPIHVAESQDEIDFLQNGQGRFRSFLEDRGVWDGSFIPPGKGAVFYLEQLDLLDEKTLCVHCVHLSNEEVLLLARKNAKVCLCPGSNRLLGVGEAPVSKMLQAGIRPCLGTDSLASNPELSMWREMQIIAENCPNLSPEIIVAMATWYGADAVSRPRRGRLAKGCISQFLSIGYDGQEPFEFLVHDQGGRNIVWV